MEQHVYNILMNNRSSALLSVAVELKLFDYIHEKHPNAIDLSAQFNFSHRGSDALLVGLASLELLELLNDDHNDWYSQRYKLSLVAIDYLRTESDLYLGHLIAMDSKYFLTPQKLMNALRLDQPNVYGTIDPWKHQQAEEEDARMFTLGMRSISISPAKALANMEIFKTRKVILDIGAGAGVHICELLKANNSMFGILYDLSNVFNTTEPYLVEQGVRDRSELVIGDMFVNDWPKFTIKKEIVDTIFFSQILHDWDLSKGQDLVQKAYETLPIGGLLLIHEKLLNSNRTRPIATAMVSLDMLFWTKGQQYTKEKLYEIFQKVGFQDFFSIPTIGYWSLTGAYKK